MIYKVILNSNLQIQIILKILQNQRTKVDFIQKMINIYKLIQKMKNSIKNYHTIKTLQIKVVNLYINMLKIIKDLLIFMEIIMIKMFIHLF